MMTVQIKCINTKLLPAEALEIESVYRQACDRFGHFIRDALLTFRDTNGPKGGIDKVCTIQLRFYPRGLAVVKSHGTSFSQAANAACDKMQQVASKRLSKKKNGPIKNSQIKFNEGQPYEN